MNITKNIIIFILIAFSSFYNAKNDEKRNMKTYFFSLFKVNKNSAYEDGFWINKWFYSREFANPINFMPIEIRYGVGATGKSKGSVYSLNPDSFKDDPSKIRYESDVTAISQETRNIWGSSIEIDIGLINIPYYLVGTSWLNVMTGLTYRSSTLFSPAQVPHSDWSNTNATWSDTAFFSPKLTEYLATTHFQYQPFNKWYLNFRYSYGLSSALFYTMDRESWDDNLSGSGTSSAGSMGIRFILDPGKQSRFSIGLDFRYSYTKIHTIDDPLDRTPITRFDLSNYGVYLTLSSFYGGNKTSGDKAKTFYYRKDYTQALKTFKQFMSEYPTHSNRHRAKEYIDDCEYKIPYQILEEGIQLEKKGRTQNALNKYQDALSKVKIDTVIIPILNKRITQIALLWMIEAEKKLKNGEYIQAYNLVKHVSEFSIEGQKELRRFKSWVLLGEGKKYQEFGFIGKAMGKYAEGLELNRDLIFEVNALQYRAGIQMAKLAKEADEYEEIQLAIYSLEFARELSGGIGNKNEDLLIKLKEKMRLLDNYKSRLIINKKMDSARKILSKARMEKLVVGQTIPQIQELLGDPHEKIIGDSGTNLEKQLWIYFMNEKSLHLTFSKFILYKIEQI